MVRVLPPSRGSISLRPMNQASIPSPVATACQACSGVAPTSISLTISNALPISDLLGLDNRTTEYNTTHRRPLDEFRPVHPEWTHRADAAAGTDRFEYLPNH